MATTRAPGATPKLPPHLDPRGGAVAGDDGTRRSSRPAPPRGTRARLAVRALRIMTLATAVLAAGAVLAVAATGYTVLQWSGRRIARVEAFAGLTDRPPPSADGSSTFLLVGSDTREGMTRAEMRALHVGRRSTAEGRRADTMLMLHVSPHDGTVTVLSLPRDSYVTIPAHRSALDGSRVHKTHNKLNAAYAWGGAPLLVATVEETTGVRIDHYLEVDFLGFVRLVDAVGGVDVCAPHRLRDRKAGLRLDRGVTHVDGQTGLAYVRARHLDARADLGRIERQQRFLGAMAARVTSRDVLLDPRALVRFLDAALDAVRADPGLSEKELVSLGTQLRHASGKDVRFRTVPIADPAFRTRSAGAVALWDTAGARSLFTAMREDTSDRRGTTRHPRLTVPPEQISVQVYNGSSVVGRGGQASSGLATLGFAMAGPAQNWRSASVERTTIRYDSRYTDSIRTLAAALPGAELQSVPGLGRTLQVITGSSYDGTRAVHVAPLTGGQPGATDVTAASDPCS